MLVQLLGEPTIPLPRHPRTQGIHLSRVLRNLAFENKVLKREHADDLDLVELAGRSDEWWKRLPEDVRLRIAMGLAWEDYYGGFSEEITYHPGELHLDGIYMTPDGESIDYIRVAEDEGEYVLALHEFKLTYKSTRTVGDLSTQWLWLAQMKGYCKAMRTRRAYLHVLFVCGDYSRPIKPMLCVWRVTFTQLELDDHWDMITTYVQHRLRQEREDEMRDTDA